MHLFSAGIFFFRYKFNFSFMTVMSKKVWAEEKIQIKKKHNGASFQGTQCNFLE